MIKFNIWISYITLCNNYKSITKDYITMIFNVIT